METRRWFEYHCYEGEDSADAELWRHTHQRVAVLNNLYPQETDIPMHRVRFDDRFECSVFDDELLTSQSLFYRPDYSS